MSSAYASDIAEVERAANDRVDRAAPNADATIRNSLRRLRCMRLLGGVDVESSFAHISFPFILLNC